MPALCVATGVAAAAFTAPPALSADKAPVPLLSKEGAAVDWWFAFKFNAQNEFAGCGPDTGQRSCIFGGEVQAKPRFGQQFVFASSAAPTLRDGHGCVGATTDDPVGATFDQVYNGRYYYVIWNDQFYGDPVLTTCKSANCNAPWGHSKGLLAWNDAGDGFVMQVSTPSWPGSGTRKIVRKVGNTLGCIRSNNNLLASQHFFALKLDKSDLLKVLDALQRAGVVTDPTKLQIVRNGGPDDVQELVDQLGQRPKKLKVAPDEDPRSDAFVAAHRDEFYKSYQLSTKVTLVAKTANLTAPPWQALSAILDGSAERAATWWTTPRIYTTTESSKVNCLLPQLETRTGPVAIALGGHWSRDAVDHEFKLGAPSNHAKIGVSISGSHHYVIFGDLNQQGKLARPDCDKSQNGRGGLFFVLDNKPLATSVSSLIQGDTARTSGPP